MARGHVAKHYNTDPGTAFPSQQFAWRCPVPGQGRFFPDFSRKNADNYCFNERNLFGGTLTRLSPKFAPPLSRFFKGYPHMEELYR